MTRSLSYRPRFADKVMMITGAAQGIGLRSAERAGSEGARLVLVDRADHIHTVADQLQQQGCEVLALQADLETWEGASDIMAQAKARFGRLDVLMVPVDDSVTMTIDGMAEIVKRLRASIVLPMHRLGTPHLADAIRLAVLAELAGD